MLITAGATEAIAAALLALLEPGDEVIAFEPYYDSYVANIAMAGAASGSRSRCARRTSAPTWTSSRAPITATTRLLLLNSPHNPTGMVLTRAEPAASPRIAVEHDLLVVTDEVYEHLIFDREHIPLATVPGMRERTVSIGSAGKTFSFTGWKVGWVTGTPELVAAVRTAKQFLTYVTSGPFQYAVARPSPCPTTTSPPCATTSRPGATCSRGAWRTSASRCTRPTAPTSSPPTSPPGRAGRRWSSAAPCPTGRAWSPSRAPSSTTTSQAGRTQVRFAFCKRPEVLSEALSPPVRPGRPHKLKVHSRFTYRTVPPAQPSRAGQPPPQCGVPGPWRPSAGSEDGEYGMTKDSAVMLSRLCCC